MPPWYTDAEKRLLDEFGGEWEKGIGVDGEIDGRPAEVRVARKDDRFRIGKDVHRELLRDEGMYIFDKLGDDLPPKKVPADDIQDMTHGDPWLEDRDYPHRFLEVDRIF